MRVLEQLESRPSDAQGQRLRGILRERQSLYGASPPDQGTLVEEALRRSSADDLRHLLRAPAPRFSPANRCPLSSPRTRHNLWALGVPSLA